MSDKFSCPNKKGALCDLCIKEINQDKDGPGKSYYICNRCSLLDVQNYLQEKINRIVIQPHPKDRK